jgi:transcriptional adapter 3
MPSKPPSATYPSNLLSLITSSAYPVTPTLEDLEALRVALQQQVSSNAIRLAENDPAERERLKKERKERKRKEREREENEERERAALEANERAGQRLEAIERARTGSASVALGTPGKQGSPAGVRIKRERTSSECAHTTNNTPPSPTPLPRSAVCARSSHACFA